MPRTLLPAVGAALALNAGCVPLPPGAEAPPPSSLSNDAGYPRLDPGSQRVTSLHFEVEAYGSQCAQGLSDAAEELYKHIMDDSALYSFLPREPYKVVLYGDRAEYLRKTGMPEWSGGVNVGRAVYLYDGPQMRPTLAHEMTHTIFNEFMGRTDPALRWINEGLAVYEEMQARNEPRGRPVSRVIPFREMVNLAPIGEKDTVVNDWYGQVSDVTRFMIERGGHVGFGEFLKALHDGRSNDEAVRIGFPGIWTDMPALETAWNAGR